MVLRRMVIGFALILSVTYIPTSVTETWPAPAQQAMEIMRDLRVRFHDTGAELIHNGADWVSTASTHVFGGVVPETLLADVGHWLPDPGDLLENALRDLLGDWWPQPTLPAGGGDLPRVAGSFASARDLLYERIHHDRRLTVYCGCKYNARRQIDLASCGLQRYAGNERARRVEAEHVFPAAQFGNFRRCWRQPEAYRACRRPNGETVSGRECCLRVDETFVAAHNDLQNLIPAVGMINGYRRDYRWGVVPGGERYGDCDIRIDANRRRVQPPDALRGDIARIMLYMSETYGFRLSRQDERLFKAWNALDPPDAWERRRQARIARLQGRENRYVVRHDARAQEMAQVRSSDGNAD